MELSLAEARRLALASQGFGRPRASVSIGEVRKLASKLGAYQIDSVNVAVRAHYVPAFARLGPYALEQLDTLAYRRRELFEYWAHAACLIPIGMYPLLRYRMHTESARDYLRLQSSEQAEYVARAFAEVGERGPLAAGELSDPGKRSGNWWGWGVGKAALEYLYDAGLLAIADRRGFERLYDLTERVIPRSALEASVPPREEAMKQLICTAANACGVGTFEDIVGYFKVDGWRDRLPPVPEWERRADKTIGRAKPIARRLVAELVEEGRLLPTDVEAWRQPAYMTPSARIPSTVEARALVTPFDSLVWERSRVERLFGMKYVLELYVPRAKRVYGYYVFLFLLGDTLAARCDLKADRQRGVLLVQSAFLEQGHDAVRIAAELAAELELMRTWLKLDAIDLAERGDLSLDLRGALYPRGNGTAADDSYSVSLT